MGEWESRIEKRIVHHHALQVYYIHNEKWTRYGVSDRKCDIDSSLPLQEQLLSRIVYLQRITWKWGITGIGSSELSAINEKFNIKSGIRVFFIFERVFQWGFHKAIQEENKVFMETYMEFLLFYLGFRERG